MKAKMKSYPKYRYPKKVKLKKRRWPDEKIKSAPLWCSVDLRDGNQSLPNPMNPDQKLAYFKLLVKIGFKDIEVGFPSASQDDFDFVRRLIEEEHIPDDVRISVLTQARKHLIDRTAESLRGVKNGLLHCYVATSDLHGEIVFNMDRDAVMNMAYEGTRLSAEALQKVGIRQNVGFEFSPEEFTDSDIDFVIDVCQVVKETWGPSDKKDFILNLPATVERRPPYQYADMIEYFNRYYKYGDETTISVHAHNDQGCAVAATEMTLLAGAERVEGTLFGHGERTGNLDIVTLAMNLHARGLDMKLDFSNMTEVVRIVEDVSSIPVHPRHPYAGQFVFTAFSGSHQDAIRKGMERRDKAAKLFKQGWKVPYLHIDPSDVGRQFEKLIRINSQSGKGGVAYVLEHEFGIYPPKTMHPEIGRIVQEFADRKGDEISGEELCEEFRRVFIMSRGPFEFEQISRVLCEELHPDHIKIELKLKLHGKPLTIEGEGNGPISAAVRALRDHHQVFDFILEEFSEQTMGKSADAKAMAFVGIRKTENNTLYYGVGEHSNIDQAALQALFSAINRAAKKTG